MFTTAEVMTRDPHTLEASASVQDAIGLMTEKHIRHIPIVDGANKLVGLVTHRDVLAATDSKLPETMEKHDLARIPLASIMEEHVATTSEKAALRSVARYMEAHKYGCLPVIHDGKLTGIVTDSDFVAVAINLLEQMEDIEPVEVLEEAGAL